MALENVITTLVLDVIDHDQTQGVVKAIALDSKTRYVQATIVQHGIDYDVDPNAVVTLTILRPDNVGVQITGSVVDVDNANRTGTIKGVYVELTQAALAVSGNLKAQFKLTVGQQILRTEIFKVNNGIALDGETSDWTDYAGYNIDELVENLNSAVAEINPLKTGLETVNTNIGDMTALQTAAKDNLVAAINEAAQTGGGGTVQKSLPKLYINGDISQSSKGAETKAYSYVFVDEDGKRHYGYNSLKWQGESSLQYPKKNYTLKFFHDALYKRKDKVDLLPLGIKKSKFVIKANWIDRSMARNVVSCRLWGQMVKSRNGAPEEHLAQAPNFGAIDGYPIKVYVNGTFHGLYSFNIPKDEDLFGMDAENPLHCVVCGDNNNNDNNNSSAFRTATIGNGNWELEVPDAWPTYDVEEEGQTVTYAVKDNLSSTIAFVINSTDEEFVAGFNDHIDLESAIDYFLLMFLECGVDSAARNLILLTYDGGNKWYCSAYDKDMTWGNGSVGAPTYNSQLPCPAGYINNNSLLWQRLTALFGDAIWARWNELKNTMLSPTNIKAEFSYFWRDIADEDYESDASKWPSMPQATLDFKTRIANFVDARWTYMDGQINAFRTPVACTGITLSESTLSFTSGDPMTLTATVEPADTTDAVVWSSSNPSVATVDNGVVTPVGEGNTTITATCGSQTATCSVSVSSLYFTVSLAGTGATLTPTTNINPNAPYTGMLTVNAGYALDSIVVEMSGVDITSSAYDNGTITIPHVTGNIVVTVATSVYIDPTGLQYSLQSPLIFDGQTYVDTGYKYSGSGSLSIFVEAENPQDMDTTQNLFGQKTGVTARMCWSATSRSIAPSLNGGNLQSGVGAIVGTRFKAVFRFDANRTVQSNRSSVSGVEKTNRYGYNSNGVTPPASVWGNNLWLGGQNADGVLANPMLTGKLYQFRIYERRLTDSETAALLGVSSLSDVITADKDA